MWNLLKEIKIKNNSIVDSGKIIRYSRGYADFYSPIDDYCNNSLKNLV